MKEDLKDQVYALWPELEWIGDPVLRDQTSATWELALSKSELTAEDLHRIPITLLAYPSWSISGAWCILRGTAAIRSGPTSGKAFPLIWTS
jgi:hypothetical protein